MRADQLLMLGVGLLGGYVVYRLVTAPKDQAPLPATAFDPTLRFTNPPATAGIAGFGAAPLRTIDLKRVREERLTREVFRQAQRAPLSDFPATIAPAAALLEPLPLRASDKSGLVRSASSPDGILITSVLPVGTRIQVGAAGLGLVALRTPLGLGVALAKDFRAAPAAPGPL